MGWGELLGGLADALGGGPPPGRRTNVERLPRRDHDADELAAAEAETRRMMQEAAREMARDFHTQVEPLRQRVEQAEAKVIDLDTNVVSRLDQMERALGEINRKGLDAERLETRLNGLILLVIALLIVTVWLGLR